MQGKILQFFLLDTLKIYFKMKIQQRWRQSRPFFFQSRCTFLKFQKRQGRAPYLALRYLNMPQHVLDVPEYT